MKKLLFISLVLTLSFAQDRSVVFNTGSPDSTLGYTIDINNTIANRITVNNDYVLEAIVFYMSSSMPDESNIKISIREDSNGVPGNLVSDLAEWEYTLNPLNLTGYNLIVTTDLCIYLDAGNYYWWQIEAGDNLTNATWIHSNASLYTYASSDNGGSTWNSQIGNAGAGGLWAEQIYETSILQGDVNSDFLLNVIDIVTIIGYIMETNSLTDEQIDLSDLNNDGIINVVDIVQLVNLVLAPIHPNPDFTLEDINPSSEYFNENIGPSFFNGQVSCYYFGKQG